VFFAALVLGWTVTAAAADRSADQFLAALQAASDRDDRAAIAAMVQYPIRTFISGWIIPIVDRQTFITSFDAFFTEEIKDLIAEAAARPRVLKPNDVIVLGNGALRAMRINGRFRIIGIVPPPPSRRVRGARRGTTVVGFRTGESSAGFNGTLARGEHERYLVHLSRNELLEVRVDRVRGRDIVAHVLEAATGAPVDARGRDGTRVWSGRAPGNGDYLIDVVRAAGGDEVLTYNLTVTVR